MTHVLLLRETASLVHRNVFWSPFPHVSLYSIAFGVLLSELKYIEPYKLDMGSYIPTGDPVTVIM